MTLEISEKTQKMLQAEAQRRHISPDRLAEELIQNALRTKKRDLSNIAGTWTEEEAQEFEEQIASLQEAAEEPRA